ncbi:MAG: DCC1-like thiol-disulfide oxidoreductase family protein [Pseudomonadota bacterium]
MIYNSDCPICAREIASYRRYAEARDLPLEFSGLTDAAALGSGLTVDEAARRLHVVKDGELLSGLAAFAALWAALPRFRWLARIVSLPVIRPVAHAVYEGVLAPLLYAMHRRRVARHCPAPGDTPGRDS